MGTENMDLSGDKIRLVNGLARTGFIQIRILEVQDRLLVL